MKVFFAHQHIDHDSNDIRLHSGDFREVENEENLKKLKNLN